MDGLGRAVGSPTTVSVLELDEHGQLIVEREDAQGKPIYKRHVYILAPLVLTDFGLMEQHLLAQRLNPDSALKPLLDKLNSVQQEMLLNIAYKDLKKGYNKVTRRELAEWVDTTDGTIFTLWLGLRKNHPEMTLEKVSELYNLMGIEEQEEVRRRRDLASGVDALGKPIGQTPPAPTQTNPSTGGS
jgi:hypothetical protein